jgi:hypothetical protein
MHLVPVIASVTKLSMALLGVQRKVERGLPRPRDGEEAWVKFHPILRNYNFLVPVIAGVIKLSMALPLAQRKVEM